MRTKECHVAVINGLKNATGIEERFEKSCYELFPGEAVAGVVVDALEYPLVTLSGLLYLP